MTPAEIHQKLVAKFREKITETNLGAGLRVRRWFYAAS